MHHNKPYDLIRCLVFSTPRKPLQMINMPDLSTSCHLPLNPFSVIHAPLKMLHMRTRISLLPQYLLFLL